MQKKKSGFNHLFTETRLGWLIIFLIASYVGMGLIAYGLKGNWKFFQGSTLQTMCCQIPEIGILAIAVMLPMITGGIDLSMVGKANLSGIVAAAFMTKMITEETPEGTQHMYAVIAILLALAVGALAGLVNGLIISTFNTTPLIVTLGSNYVFMGIAVIITRGQSITGLPKAFNALGQGFIGFLPAQFLILIIVVLVAWFLIAKTSYGTKLFMMGANATAAGFSGINMKKMLCATYTISGVFSAIAGCILFGRSSQANADYGTTYTLQAIMIAVLGGTSPNGGEGNVLGVFFAMMTMQFLATGLNFFQVTNVTYLKDIVWGAVLIIVMTINHFQDVKHAKAA